MKKFENSSGVHFPKSNKCCENNKNIIVIKQGWSGLCKKCGRYHYDFVEHQLTVKESAKHLFYYVLNNKSKLLLTITKKVKSPLFKNIIKNLMKKYEKEKN